MNQRFSSDIDEGERERKGKEREDEREDERKGGFDENIFVTILCG